MGFWREEWTNALKYYQLASKSTINQIESHETIPEKKYTKDEKENVSQLFDNEMKCHTFIAHLQAYCSNQEQRH